jgi:predicted transcriptional regulator
MLWSFEDEYHCYELHAAGASYQRIAEQVGRTPNSVRKMLNSRGLHRQKFVLPSPAKPKKTPKVAQDKRYQEALYDAIQKGLERVRIGVNTTPGTERPTTKYRVVAV